MSEHKQSLEQAVFELATQKPTAAERVTFLNSVCRDNPVLRARLDSLIEAHLGGAGFLTQNPKHATAPPPVVGPPAEEAPARMIGRYKLLEKIGEGGFGEVWMAEQREPVKRRVALKIIKPGMDSKQVVARFEAERQALALMDHPNIAKVLDGGIVDSPQAASGHPLPSADEARGQGEGSQALATRHSSPPIHYGRPYFVMELVRGVPITEYCDKNALPTHERLKLFILVCQAIQHAHQKGIIHRDIKPSNVLVTLHDGVPVPKVIDFGIAKAMQQELTDKTMFTQFQQFIGTPAYVSPEQAEMSGLDIDTRADIYSLGVLLYELLVGKTPFDVAEMVKDGIDALRKLIREKEPVRPSTKLSTLQAEDGKTAARYRQTDLPKLIHLLRGDLDWIVMKCLEKDRRRRYETANGLAMEIHRFLGNEPIIARPPSVAYRFQKFARRNKLAVTAATLVTLVLAVGAAAVIFVQHRANRDYRQRLYLSDIGRAGIAWQAGQVAPMLALLDQCPNELRDWEWRFLRSQADLWSETVFFAATNLAGAALSADGHSLVVAASAGFQILDFPTGQWRHTLSGPGLSSWRDAYAVSPVAEQLATLTTVDSTIRIWNLRTGELLTKIHHEGAVHALAWTPDGQQLASSGSDASVRLWDVKTGNEQRAIPTASPALALAFAPDGRTLAVGAWEAAVQLWDITNGVVKRTLLTSVGRINRLKFSPDGQRLAVGHLTWGSFQNLSRVWHLGDGESLDLHSSGSAPAFAFSPDGRRLLVGDEAGIIHLWDLERRVETYRVSAHLGRCDSVRFLEDGRILSVGADGTIKISQARPSGIVRMSGHTASLRTLAFSPDSHWLASAGIAEEVIIWDVHRGQLAQIYTNHSGGAPAVTFSPHGRVATASDAGMVQQWNPATLQTEWTQSLAPVESAWWLAYSPDNRRLFAASADGTVTMLDAATGHRLGAITGFSNPTDGLAVAPDGRLIAVAQKQKLSVWFADGSKELWQAPANLNRCAAFSPDGKWIATAGQDSVVTLWKVESKGRVRRFLRGHSAMVTGVAFSPGGRRLVSSGMDGVKVWDPSTGVELLNLPLQGGGAWHVAFSPDGKSIAAAGGDGVVTLWKTE